MIFIVGGLAVFLLVYGPQFWVKFVLWKHSKDIGGMPGTGGELAKHLVERFQLEGVTVEEGSEGQDHYNPADKRVSLSPTVYAGRSLTAVAIAAHEVGHAIQFVREEPVSQLRNKYMGKAIKIKKAGTVVLTVLPIIAIIIKVPHLFAVAAIVGVITMLVSMLMYVAVLPEEYDASFNKALPILAEGYVPEKHLPAVRQVLRAAAYTYVAGALADVLRLWRWFRIIR